MDNNNKLQILKKAIRTYNDFPQPGVIFRDIFSVFHDPVTLRILKDLIMEHVSKLEFDLVVGMDARGFLLGPTICIELGKPFLPIRKKGKLPGKVMQQKYTLEYGHATVELQTEFISSGSRVLVVDDLLATGGTMAAAIKLLNSVGANVIECFVVMELTSLKGRDKLDAPLHSLVQFDE